MALDLDPELISGIEDIARRWCPDFLEMLGGNRQDVLARDLKIDLFDHQVLMNFACERHKRLVGAACRRSGKTYFFLHKLTDSGLRFRLTDYAGRDRTQPGRFMYVAPTLTQAMEIAWPILNYIADKIGARAMKSDRRIVLRNECEIVLGGARNPDSLRGTYLDGVLFDEYAYMAKAVWEKVIRAQLMDWDGFAWFFSTPAGRNHFHDLVMRAMGSEEWGVFRLPGSQINHFSEAKLAAYREDVGDFAYMQEIECDFDAPVDGAYWGDQIWRIKQAGQVGHFPLVPDVPVFCFADLGVDDLMCLWWGQVIGGRFRWLECVAEQGRSLAWVVTQLQEFRTRHEVEYALIGMPHDLRVREMTNDDGAGHAVSREITLRRLIRERGVARAGRVVVAPRGRVAERVQAARSALKVSDFHEGGRGVNRGINALSLYQRSYDSERNCYADQPLKNWTSHYADAFGGMCHLMTAHRKMVEKTQLGAVSVEDGDPLALLDPQTGMVEAARETFTQPKVLGRVGGADMARMRMIGDILNG